MEYSVRLKLDSNQMPACVTIEMSSRRGEYINSYQNTKGHCRHSFWKARDIARLFYAFLLIVSPFFMHVWQTWPMSLITSGMKCDKSVLIRHSVRNSLVMTSHFTDTGRQHCQCNILIVFSSPNPKITEAIGKKEVRLLYIREPLISKLMWNVSSSYTALYNHHSKWRVMKKSNRSFAVPWLAGGAKLF